MNTDLRELFERDVDSEPPHDLAERAVRGARTRRRNRFTVGGAVIAAAAVVLGVVVSGQVRTDSAPRPTDVAAIPSVLPPADSGATLVPGQMQSAAAAYVADGVVALVDASSGEVVTVRPRGTTDGPVVAAVGVAVSPDGESLVIDYGTHLGILSVERATITELRQLEPVDDAGGATVARPSAYAWENDSQHFVCSCAVDGRIPQVVRVTRDGTWEPVDSDASPVQVAAGSAGVAAQLEANGGPWVSVTNLAPAIPPSYAAALGRGADPTYIAFRGSGFTLGEVGGAESFSGLLPSASVEGQYLVVTDVDAVVDGFVASVAYAQAGEGFSDPADAVVRAEAVFIRSDGAYQDLVSLPTGAVAASFASDLVAP